MPGWYPEGPRFKSQLDPDFSVDAVTWLVIHVYMRGIYMYMYQEEVVEGEQSCLVVGVEVEGAGAHWVRRVGVVQEGASASWQVEDLDKEIYMYAYTYMYMYM